MHKKITLLVTLFSASSHFAIFTTHAISSLLKSGAFLARARSYTLSRTQVHHQLQRGIRNSTVIAGILAGGVVGSGMATSTDGVYKPSKVTIETGDKSTLDMLHIKCSATDISPFHMSSQIEALTPIKENRPYSWSKINELGTNRQALINRYYSKEKNLHFVCIKVFEIEPFPYPNDKRSGFLSSDGEHYLKPTQVFLFKAKSEIGIKMEEFGILRKMVNIFWRGSWRNIVFPRPITLVTGNQEDALKFFEQQVGMKLVRNAKLFHRETTLEKHTGISFTIEHSDILKKINCLDDTFFQDRKAT